MNLVVEYLVRTGVIRNFLQLPCSVCLENIYEGQMLVELEDSDCSGSILVTHYDLDRLRSDGCMPYSKQFKASATSLFRDTKIVLPGYTPIPFVDQPLDTSQNKYNQPMADSVYESLISEFLNPEVHRKSREAWLWKAFRNLHLADLLPNLGSVFERRLFAGLERSYTQEQFPEKWAIWCDWKSLLKSTTVAPELIFRSAYEKAV